MITGSFPGKNRCTSNTSNRRLSSRLDHVARLSTRVTRSGSAFRPSIPSLSRWRQPFVLQEPGARSAPIKSTLAHSHMCSARDLFKMAQHVYNVKRHLFLPPNDNYREVEQWRRKVYHATHPEHSSQALLTRLRLHDLRCLRQCFSKKTAVFLLLDN